MTPVKGWLDPEARATLDAVLSRWAAPGMCNPAEETPCLDGTPSQAAIDGDTRSAGQRNHDALTALGRALLASGDLGHHNGLPASIIVSVSLAELESGTGKAHTGGGTWLPMSDVIRLASHAHHYLRIYDGAKELALYHSKRLASPGQRMVLYAGDREDNALLLPRVTMALVVADRKETSTTTGPAPTAQSRRFPALYAILSHDSGNPDVSAWVSGRGRGNRTTNTSSVA
jgi:hypothetical protein